MAAHIVGRPSELKPGERKLVELEGRSIGVFNVNGTFYALRNVCPHQGAELCRGQIMGLMLPSEPGEYRQTRQGEILKCPWHGWEFDITTGESIFDPFRCRVRSYDVSVEPTGDETGEGAHGGVTEWPKAETYPVEVDDGYLVVHV